MGNLATNKSLSLPSKTSLSSVESSRGHLKSTILTPARPSTVLIVNRLATDVFRGSSRTEDSLERGEESDQWPKKKISHRSVAWELIPFLAL